MQTFSLAHSTSADWRHAVQACLDQLDWQHATLGFLYATDHFAPHLGEILQACKTRSSSVQWVGTVGVGICCTGQEYLDTPALAILLTDIPSQAFRLLPNLTSLGDVLAQASSFKVNGHLPWLGIVHGDPRNQEIAELVEQVANQTESGFLVGGLTSSRNNHPQIAGEIVEGGLSGVLFTEAVTLATRLTQGAYPLGPRHLITRCEQNVILSLDNRPPLDVLLDDLEIPASQLSHALDALFVGLPTRDSDTEDYLVRQVMGIDLESKLIAVGDYLEPGQPLMFCRRDSTSAELDMHRMLQDIKARLTGPAKGAVYYSCLGRGANLFGPDSEELKLIRAALGDIPLVGFFANGEISRNRLYGWTGVLTVFS